MLLGTMLDCCIKTSPSNFLWQSSLQACLPKNKISLESGLVNTPLTRGGKTGPICWAGSFSSLFLSFWIYFGFWIYFMLTYFHYFSIKYDVEFDIFIFSIFQYFAYSFIYFYDKRNIYLKKNDKSNIVFCNN